MHVLRSRQNKPKYGTKDGLHRITQYPAELAGWIYKYIFWIHAETKVGGLPPIADEYIQLRRGEGGGGQIICCDGALQVLQISLHIYIDLFQIFLFISRYQFVL